MSHKYNGGADSFSANDDPQNSNLDSSQRDKNIKLYPRNDSPIFGISPNKPSAMSSYNSVTDSNRQSSFSEYQPVETLPMNQGKSHSIPNFGGMSTSQQPYELAKTKKYDSAMIEHLILNSKYKIALLRMETSLIKLTKLLWNRNVNKLSYSFNMIKNHAWITKINLQYKSLKIYNKFESNIIKLVKTLNKITDRHILKTYHMLFLRLKINIIIYKCEKDKHDLINKYKEKDEIIKKENLVLQQKLEENSTSSKNRENELREKLKKKEKQFMLLEQEKNELKKKSINVVDTDEIKQLRIKMKEITEENEYLKQKISYTENNVETFIKDMSDLLGSHDVSTTIGLFESGLVKSFGGNSGNSGNSGGYNQNNHTNNNYANYEYGGGQDNDNSNYQNGYHEDNYQNNRVKNPLSANNTNNNNKLGYDNTSNNAKQNTRSSSSSQNPAKYPKNVQINYCFIQLDNPLLKHQIFQPALSKTTDDIIQQELEMINGIREDLNINHKEGSYKKNYEAINIDSMKTDLTKNKYNQENDYHYNAYFNGDTKTQ